MESPRAKLQRVSSEDFRTPVRGQAVKQKCRNAVCAACSCFHHDTEPKSIAAEKEIVRDFTEKRLLHRVFITTQCPNRLPQRRRLFVMSQRNVCYIVFSSRHRAPNRLPQRRRLFVMSQRNVCHIVFSSRHRAQIDCRREGDCS